MVTDDFEFELVVLEEDTSGTVCNDDWSGERHAHRCNVSHSQVGETWERVVTKNCRKLYIQKNTSQGGSDRLELYHKDKLVTEQVIGPGTRGDFLGKDKRDVRVRITTTQLGGDGFSRYYVHLEWYA